MDDFSRYERMKGSGASPARVHEAGRADGLDSITLIRLVRQVFGLSLADAKRAIGAGDRVEAGPEIREGSTVRWEGVDPEEGAYFMEASVASIEDGTARLEHLRKYRPNEGGLEQVPLAGPDHCEMAVSYLERSLVQRLEEALRESDEPAATHR